MIRRINKIIVDFRGNRSKARIENVHGEIVWWAHIS